MVADVVARTARSSPRTPAFRRKGARTGLGGFGGDQRSHTRSGVRKWNGGVWFPGSHYASVGAESVPYVVIEAAGGQTHASRGLVTKANGTSNSGLTESTNDTDVTDEQRTLFAVSVTSVKLVRSMGPLLLLSCHSPALPALTLIAAAFPSYPSVPS